MSEPQRVLPAFAAQVYRLVAAVPEGKVTTYGALARALGDPRKAREVGWALAATPAELDLPTHRVINNQGVLSGAWAFGGYERHRALLEDEGVRFLADGRADLDAHLWQPPAGGE